MIHEIQINSNEIQYSPMKDSWDAMDNGFIEQFSKLAPEIKYSGATEKHNILLINHLSLSR